MPQLSSYLCLGVQKLANMHDILSYLRIKISLLKIFISQPVCGGTPL